VTAIRSIRTEMALAPALAIPLVLTGVSGETAARARRWEDVIKRMARISEIGEAAVPPAGAVQLVVRGETVVLPLKGIIDLGAEKARLDKELAKIDAEIARIDAKLGNADFVARAPEEVVEADREKREEAALRRGKIIEALERLCQME
jgi:valyl-tRNA synthetase